MDDFTASRKTAFQIKVNGDDDDDDGDETTITVKGGGRSTSKNRSIKYVCPKTAGHPLDIAPETAAMMAASVHLGGYADADTVTAMESEKAAETAEATEITEQPAPEKIAYTITGDRRKALVAEIVNYTGEKAIYQNAPSFAYHIGPYAVDKNGTLTGPIDHSLIRWLASEGSKKPMFRICPPSVP